MLMRPFVVYWNNIPAPYMVERFNALAEHSAFEFEAWFSDRTHSDRSWEVDESSWRFRHRYLPVTRLGHRVLHWPLPLLGRRPDVMVSGYAEPAWLVGWTIARLRGTKTCFRVLSSHDAWVRRSAFKEMLKRFVFSRVDAVETPGEDGKAYSMRYGISEDKVFFTTHTVDVQWYISECAEVRASRNEHRHRIGVKGTTFIYVGRLWHGKGLEYLLDAFGVVQSQCVNDVSLLLVGDGQMEAVLRRASVLKGLRNVVFAGFKQKRDLPIYYASADVFVFPTLGDPYGLVVDEAMTCSLPVVSTSAAGEIHDRIEEGVNGFIVPPRNSAELADRMLRLVQDLDLRERMGKISLLKASSHTPEQWVKDFENIVRMLLPKWQLGSRGHIGRA